MSIRKLFQGNGGVGRIGGAAVARRRARGMLHNVLPASVELLETRTLLSAVIPGLTEHGLAIDNSDAVGQSEITVTAADDAVLSGNANGSGLFINLNGDQADLSALQRIRITGATIDGNGNAGAQIHLANMTLDTLIVDSSVFTNNGTNGDGSGLFIDLTNVTINNLIITDSGDVTGASTFANNEFDGVTINASGATIESFDVNNSVFEDNNANGASFDFVPLIRPDLDTPAPGDLETIISSVANFSLDGNTAQNNTGGSGIAIRTNRTDIGEESGQIVNNTFSGNSADGLSILSESIDQNSNPTPDEWGAITIDAFNDNVAENNGGAGVNVILREQTLFEGTFLRNEFSSNGRRGFNITGTEVVDTKGDSDPLNDESLNAYDIQFGTLKQDALGAYVDANTFDGNTGAAIAIELVDLAGTANEYDTLGTFRVLGNQILNSVDGSVSPLYTGEGINVRLRGGVQFANGAARMLGVVIDGNTISGNAGEGIRFNVTEDSELADLTIGNLTGANQTFDVNGSTIPGGNNVDTVAGDGNAIADNGGHGIAIVRRGSAWVHDIKIFDNTIVNNENGILVHTSDTYIPVSTVPDFFPDTLVTELTINRNDIRNNNANGLRFRTELNAVLLVDMRYNRIDGNAVEGILSTAIENTETDFENIGGTWIKNAITNNGQNGIKIEAVTGTVNPLIIGRDGIDVIDEQSLGNFIAFNGEDGIDIQNIQRVGGTVVPDDEINSNDVSIVNNQIIGNGQNALDGSPDPYTAGKGIDIEMHATNRRFTIHRNIIEGNVGDGIEIMDHWSRLGLIAQGNTIQGNGGRGVDLLVKGNGPQNALAHVVFGGPRTDDPTTINVNEDASNLISNNGLEGFYAVTTAASAQRQDVTAETALEVDTANNATESVINLVLDVFGNEIRGNGSGVAGLGTPPSTFAGTGLVVRVGSQNTAEGHSTTPDLSGEEQFNTDSASAGVGSNYSGRGNGRTNLRVVGNEFSGNAGDDVTLGTFVSCLPPDTPGNWDDPTNDQGFRVNPGYERDPLARLNVTFVGNTGESLDVTRGETSNDFNIEAAYRNNEETFKRRINNAGDAEPIPDGPFVAGTDPRLVNRVADRAVNNNDGALSDAFGDFSGLNLGAPFGPGNAPTITGFGGTMTGDVDDLVEAPVAGGFSGDPPIRITVTSFEVNPGARFRVEISGTGTPADGSHSARLIDYNQDDNEAIFDLYDAADYGSYNGDNEYLGGGTPVTLGGATFSGDGTVVLSQSITSITAAPKTPGAGSDPAPTRVTAVLQRNPGQNFLVTISGSGSPITDGTHFARLIDFNGATGEAVFDLYVPTDVGFYSGDEYAGGGSPVPFDSAAGLGAEIIIHNPNKFYYDGIGPSTLRVEGNWAFTNNFQGGGSFDSPASVPGREYVPIAWDEVDTGTFSFLTASINSDFNVDEAAGIAELTVTLSEPAPQGGVQVFYSTSDGDAQAGSDYTAKAGSLTFAEGETTQTISIFVDPDNSPETNATVEGPESFYVDLTLMTGSDGVVEGAIVDRRGVITLNEPPVVSISDGELVQRDADDGTIVPATTEGDPGDETYMQYTISLAGGGADPVTVQYSTAPGTGPDGASTSDFTSTTGSVTFQEGETTKTVLIPIIEDIEPENAENFTVNLTVTSIDPDTGDANATVGDDSGLGTIVDDDTPSITIDDVVVTETGGDQSMTFTVSLSKAISEDVIVDYSTSDQSALDGQDYTGEIGAVTVLAGQTSATISITIKGDGDPEPTETFVVNLDGATILGNDVSDAIEDDLGVGSIIDDDIPTISIGDAILTERDTGAQDMEFTLTREGDASDTVTVTYSTTGGTATEGVDFDETLATVTFNPGETTKTIAIPIFGDDLTEGDETDPGTFSEQFTVNIIDVESTGQVRVEDGIGTGTIVDDDRLTFSIGDGQITETDGTRTMTFIVTLSETVGEPVSIDYATANGTGVNAALDGEDFTGETGTLNFAAGETNQVISITILGDNDFEETETFFVDLTNPSDGRLGDDRGLGTIFDDDTPTISVSDGELVEGDDGEVDQMAFTITLTGDTSDDVTVDYQTFAGTATANVDYTSSSGVVVFSPGDGPKTVLVPIIGDTDLEPDETFTFKLTNISSAGTVRVADDTGLGTIIDNDTPDVTIGDAQIVEEDGDTTITFDVTLSGAVSDTVTVQYATADLTAVGGASGDYEDASGTVTFDPGETTQTISITVNGDNLEENTEEFNVLLSNPVNAEIDDAVAVGTIIDDDTVSVAISDGEVVEGDSGSRDMVFTLTLQGDAITSPVTVEYETAGGTATSGDDFNPVSGGSVTFAPGETTKEIRIAIFGDEEPEENEEFTVRITSVSPIGSAEIRDGVGTGTILNDDTPGISIDDVTITEGDADTTATFTVTLSEPVTEDVTVDFATIGQSADEGADYDGVSGTLTFTAGQTSKTIDVTINGDQLFEDTETFLVQLSNAVNGDLVDDTGLGSIVDDDRPQVSVSDAEIVEGDDVIKNMAFTITLSGDVSDDVTVTYQTAPGTANQGDDFEFVSGNVTFDFSNGDTTKTVFVPINGDTVLEPDETFTLNLTDATSAGTIRIGDGSGLGTIIDDDRPTVSIGDAEVTESDGNTTITFTATLSEAIGQTVTAQYETADNTAFDVTDYIGETGTITFNPGQTSQQVTITIVGDNDRESTESFFVNLTSATNARIGDGEGEGTIHDDDTPAISIGDASIVENDFGSQTMEFTITRNGDGTDPITVTYQTAPGTASDNLDFDPVTESVTLTGGQTTVAVTIFGDVILEGDETFTVEIINVASAGAVVVADGSGTGTIIDNDTPSITISDEAATELEGSMVFSVELSKAIAGATVFVQYEMIDGSATGGGVDYVSSSGFLSFAPGQTVQTIIVPVDSTDSNEVAEDFFISLSFPSNATIADPIGRGVIIDADGAVGLVTAPQAGHAPLVNVYDARASNIEFSFYAYPTRYRGGVDIATGDVNNDGILDIVTIPQGTPRFGPLVRVFDGASGSLMKQFFAFGRNGGRSTYDIAVGDVNDDGYSDIIVGIANGISAVRVYSGEDLHVLTGFFAYGDRYRGGVKVAAGDVDGDGRAEIVTMRGSAGLAHVRVFHGDTGVLDSQFFALPPRITFYSYNIAAGDVTGDGSADIIVSMASGPPSVRVFDGQNNQLVNKFRAYGNRMRGGVSVGVGDVDFDGDADVITAPAGQIRPALHVYDGLTGSLLVSPQTPYSIQFDGGVNVAGHLYESAFLKLDGHEIVDSGAASLRQGQAAAMAEAAIEKFRAAGASQETVDRLAATEVRVADLAGRQLALSRAGAIVFDVNAAGHGWFVDSTPLANEEFAPNQSGDYQAVAAIAKGKVDLLSVVTHELAHQLGLDDLDSRQHDHELMTATLAPGMRRAANRDLEGLFEDSNLLNELLTA